MKISSDFEKGMRKAIGTRLKMARKSKGLSQQGLAKRVGFMSGNAIAQYERGSNGPSPGSLYRLAKELNCTADWLLGLTTEEQDEKH